MATKNNIDKFAGIEYCGIPGASKDCQEAVLRLLQYGDQIVLARILTCGRDHCLLLTYNVSDIIAIKSGFASGYVGEGPRSFSYVLQLLNTHGAEIEEYIVESDFIARLDSSSLRTSDFKRLEKTKPVRPARWGNYILESDFERAQNGALWTDFPPIVPYAIIDSRIFDLALSFWKDPDDRLMKGYRRLEDLVRERTGVDEHGAKLFARAFAGDAPPLRWKQVSDGEKMGRTNLFTAAYLAHRNPRAHRELESRSDVQLVEFLLLNHLFRLEKEAHLATSL